MGYTQSRNELDLVQVAQGIRPIIAEGIAEGEDARRLPETSFRSLVDSGLLHALKPARYGGAEAHPRAFYEAVSEVGKTCAATAWILGVVGVHDYALATMEPEAQDDVWTGGDDAVVASAYAPAGKATPTDGGFVLNGEWPFSSGSDYADWWLLGGLVPDPDGGAPEQRVFLVPKADLDLLDDWHTFGLRATGSRTAVVSDAFVPAHRTHRFSDIMANTNPGTAQNDGPLYAIPYLSILPFATTVGSIGAAKGVYEEFCAGAEKRRSRAGNVGGADDGYVLLALSESQQRIDAVEHAMLRNLDTLYELDATPDSPHLDERVRVRRDASTCVEQMLQVILRMYTLAGSSVVYNSSPIQRQLRDVAAMRAHAMNYAAGAHRLFAQHALDVPVSDPRF